MLPSLAVGAALGSPGVAVLLLANIQLGLGLTLATRPRDKRGEIPKVGLPFWSKLDSQ